MTRSEILRLTAGVLWLAVFSLIAAERRIVRRLRRSGAVDSASAASLSAWSPLIRLRLAWLLRSGAVVGTAAGRYYLDDEGFARYRRRRKHRALTVLAVMLPLLGLAWWLSS